MVRVASKLMLVCSLIAAVGLGISNTAWASAIGPGFDLLATREAFLPMPDGSSIPLVGMPIDARIGNTDTIVERKTGLPSDGTGMIQAEIVALSLRSIQPVPIEDSFFDVFVTLDNRMNLAGEKLNPSTGYLDILTHDGSGGTFDSFFDVFVKVTLMHVADLNGTNSNGTPTFFVHDQISSSGTPWSHTPPPGYPAEGTEFNLPSGDPPFTSGNFFITTAGIQHTGPHPQTDPAQVPEPATLLLLGSGLVGLGAAVWRGHRPR